MDLRFQNLIDGAFVDTKDTFESIDPSNGKPWAIIPAASIEDVDLVIGGSARAFESAESKYGASEHRSPLCP